jgi:hypothetical protein
MAQIFPRWTNSLALVMAVVGAGAGVLAVGGVWYYFSPEYTDVGYRPEQPVPYSHALHAGELGIDCLYCHASVEVSPVATLPPTKVCMNCHTLVARDSEVLEPLRRSASTGRPMRWVRVHNLPDYAYFDHSVHLRAGVGCASCHGRIDLMEVVSQAEPLSMSWCLACHREPGPHLRPESELTNMEWAAPPDHAGFAAQAIQDRGLHPPEDCSGCHR